MARRATLIDSLRTSGVPFLHVDLGDFMPTQAEVMEQRSRFFWSEMARLGVRLTTPGRRELAAWYAYLPLVQGGEIPVVASNVLHQVQGEPRPIGAQTRIEDVAGVRLGFLGLLGGAEFAAAKVPDDIGLLFIEPEVALAELLPELRAQVDLVVLLSQMGSRETDRLLESVPGIDVALYGSRAAWVEEAERRGGTIVQQTGSRGQYWGQLDLVVGPSGGIVDFASHNLPLGGFVANDPETQVRVEEAELVSNRLHREARLAADLQRESEKGPVRYLGAETCRRCHVAEYEQWKTTPHATAFSSLEADHGMTRTDDCTGCHVTGWKQPGGFVSASAAPDLRNVQCEACHGPGTEHVRTGGASRLGEAVCTTCHQGEFAKDWDFARDYDRVRHDR